MKIYGRMARGGAGWLAWFLLFFAGCGGDPGESEVISAKDGGTVQVSNSKSPIYRSKAVFPGGAFSVDTRVTVSAGDSFVTDPYLAQGPAVNFAGQNFDPASASLGAQGIFTIPYALSGHSSLLSESDLVIFLKERPTVFFSGADLTLDTNNKTASFSSYYIGTYQAGLLKTVAINKGEALDMIFSSSGTYGYRLLTTDAAAELLIALSPFPGSVLTSPSVTTFNFTATSSEASGALSKISALPSSVNLSGGPSAAEMAAIQQGRQRVAEMEEKVFAELLARRHRYGLATKPAPKLLPQTDPPIGTVYNVQVLNVFGASGGNYITVPSTVKATNAHSIILVDNQTIANYPATVDTVVSDSGLVFEKMIYPRDTQLFGSPSDVDGNGKIAIFLSDRFLGTGILGFYTYIDVLTKQVGSTGDSNECDLIYTVFPTGSGSYTEPLVFATIAHEFQHLINFNGKTLSKIVSGSNQTGDPAALANAPRETSWFNEGFSHFAEDAAGFADISAGPFQLVAQSLFANAYTLAHTSLVDDSGYISSAVRALNYLFVRYLFEQAGAGTVSGEDWSDSGGLAALQALIRGNYSGLSSVYNLFGSYDKNGPRDYRQLWGDFLLAMWNDGYHDSVSSAARWNYLSVFMDGRSDGTELLVPNSHIGIDLNSTRTLVDVSRTFTINFPPASSFPTGGISTTGTVNTAAPYYLRFKRSNSSGELKLSVTGNDGSALIGKIFRVN